MGNWVIGIDEAGRGSLAGPVTVGAFAAKEKIGSKILKNIFDNKLRDSKKLSPEKREKIYKELLKMKKVGEADFAVAHSSPKMIDEKGISSAIRVALSNCLKKLHHTFSIKHRVFDMDGWEKCIVVRLDGGLGAPMEYKSQNTIIKGDEKDIWIACASIVAKVTRDRLMCRLSRKFPQYCFEIHKGYGTALHYKLIKKYDLSEIHRQSFCKNRKVW